MRRRTVSTTALFLRGTDYRDADRIVTLLTAEAGKASYVARNARRSRRRFGASLQPFLVLEVELSHGQAELGSLLEAHVARSFPRILTELRRMAAGYEALELLRELSPEHEPDPAVFASALGFLTALDSEQTVPESLGICFAIRLLALYGFGPQLERCGVCGKRPATGQAAEFDPRLGHLVCRGCGGARFTLSGAVRERLARAEGPDWLAAASSAWSDTELAQARDALGASVEQRIGKPLRAGMLSAVAGDPRST